MYLTGFHCISNELVKRVWSFFLEIIFPIILVNKRIAYGLSKHSLADTRARWW